MFQKNCRLLKINTDEHLGTDYDLYSAFVGNIRKYFLDLETRATPSTTAFSSLAPDTYTTRVEQEAYGNP